MKYLEGAWSVEKPVAMVEWPENKMNETDCRTVATAKCAEGDRPGERVFQVGEKSPKRQMAEPILASRWPVDSEKFDIHSFLATARCSQKRSSSLYGAYPTL